MREILFRGKTEKAEWVEGSLLYDEEQKEAYIAEHFEDKSAYLRPVIPDTVGQYTGLTDKNGKKIFEGDIVNFEYLETTVKNAVIEYAVASFYGNTEFDSWELDDYCGLEVIGNIHDNPILILMEEKV